MIFLLVALLAFSVIGCAKKDTNPNEDTNIVNEEENKGNDEAL